MTTEILRPVADPKSLSLYPFQTEAIESLRVAARAGHHRIILCSPTGSGKTEMAIHLIQEAQAKGSRVTFVVDGISLAEQTSARLTSYGIAHGYAQAKNTRGRGEKIQVAMAQTIEKREFWTDLDLLIIDECHIQRKVIQGFARKWGGRAIGLTATPIVKGLRETWEAVVNATTTDALVAAGHLAPVEIYAATEIDMKGAAKTAGEWTSGAVRERSGPVIGDIVSTWAKYTSEHFGGPAKTLLFSADTAHGAELCQAFQAAGYDFRQSTYRDSNKETTSMVEGFRRGAFTGLVSVAKFVKGFDVPDVLVGVDARPNSGSLAEVVQKLGRVMRSSPGKDKAIWLCHAGNMAGWYEEIREIWANGVNELPEDDKGGASRKEGDAREDVICLGCGFVLPPGAEECPSCGKARVRRTKTEIVPGRMERMDDSRPRSLPDWAADREWVWQQVSALALYRKAGDIDAAQRSAAGHWHFSAGVLGLPWGILAAGQGIVGSALAVAVFVDYIVGVLCVPAQGSQHRLDQGAPGAGLVLTQNLLVLGEAVAHGFQGGGTPGGTHAVWR